MEVHFDKKQGWLQASLTPEELISQQFARPKAGDTFSDAIRALAWRLLNIYAKEIMKDNTFEYGDAAAYDGKFVVTFFNSRIVIPTEPGGA